MGGVIDFVKVREIYRLRLKVQWIIKVKSICLMQKKVGVIMTQDLHYRCMTLMEKSLDTILIKLHWL